MPLHAARAHVRHARAGARLTRASRGPPWAPSSCHRGMSTSDAGDGVASFGPLVHNGSSSKI